MVSARGFMAALGVVALGAAAGPERAAAAQAGMGTDNAPQATYVEREAPAEPAMGQTAAQPIAVQVVSPVPPTTGKPAEVPPVEVPKPPVVPALPASPVAEEAVAATPAAGRTPLALSHDAPDTAPTVGVIGGSGGSGPSPAATPEPSTLLLMGAGLAGLYRLRHRR